MPTKLDAKVAIEHLAKADPVLGKLIGRVGPFTLVPEKLSTPFGALAESIVYQQLTGKAAATIFGRVKALFDARRMPTPEEIAGVPEENLRLAGLSNAKTRAIFSYFIYYFSHYVLY